MSSESVDTAKTRFQPAFQMDAQRQYFKESFPAEISNGNSNRGKRTNAVGVCIRISVRESGQTELKGLSAIHRSSKMDSFGQGMNGGPLSAFTEETGELVYSEEAESDFNFTIQDGIFKETERLSAFEIQR